MLVIANNNYRFHLHSLFRSDILDNDLFISPATFCGKNHCLHSLSKLKLRKVKRLAKIYMERKKRRRANLGLSCSLASRWPIPHRIALLLPQSFFYTFHLGFGDFYSLELNSYIASIDLDPFFYLPISSFLSLTFRFVG